MSEISPWDLSLDPVNPVLLIATFKDDGENLTNSNGLSAFASALCVGSTSNHSREAMLSVLISPGLNSVHEYSLEISGKENSGFEGCSCRDIEKLEAVSAKSLLE